MVGNVNAEESVADERSGALDALDEPGAQPDTGQVAPSEEVDGTSFTVTLPSPAAPDDVMCSSA